MDFMRFMDANLLNHHFLEVGSTNVIIQGLTRPEHRNMLELRPFRFLSRELVDSVNMHKLYCILLYKLLCPGTPSMMSTASWGTKTAVCEIKSERRGFLTLAIKHFGSTQLVLQAQDDGTRSAANNSVEVGLSRKNGIGCADWRILEFHLVKPTSYKVSFVFTFVVITPGTPTW